MEEINAFKDYLLMEKKYSSLTAIAYISDVESFFNSFVSETETKQYLTEIDYNNVRNWIVTMMDSNLSAKTINRKISSLNTFFKYLLKVEVISSNPLSKHKSLKTKKKVQIPFSKEEINNTLEIVNGNSEFESVRNKYIIELLYATGIRRTELINIKLVDVDIKQKTLKVIGKRNKERVIPLLPSLILIHTNYLQLRNNGLEIINASSYLFLTQKGNKIYGNLIYRLTNSFFSNTSSKKKTSPHILRHSFATHLLNEGANLNAVKELLGHTSLASTQVYTFNNINELSKVYKKSHPRNKN